MIVPVPSPDSAQALDRFMRAQGYDAPTRAAALAALAPPPAAPPPIPWETFEALLMEQYAPALRARDTRRSIEHAVRVVRGLGVNSPADLTIGLITKVVTTRDPALSPNTVKSLLRVIQAVCNHAVSFAMLAESPFVKRPLRTWVRAVKPRGIRHLTTDQMKALFAVLDADVLARTGWSLYRARRLRAIVKLVAYSGLRRSEALWAHVDDLDLDRGVVWVRSRPSHRLKTDSSEKPCTLLEPAIAALRDWLLHRNDSPPGVTRPATEYLFPNLFSATPWTQGSRGQKPLHRLQAVAKRAGIEHIGFQVLRRTVAVGMEGAGASAAQIQRQLRHSNVTVTQDYYMGADRDNMRKAMDGFGY